MIHKLLGLVRSRPVVGMAAGTVASRATGLLRTVALAAVLGVGSLSDAYNIANTVPNMLFALVAGGVIGSALVPMLSADGDDDQRRDTASVVLGTITAWTAACGLLLAFGASSVISLLTAGAEGRGDEREMVALASTWLRWFSPQLPLYAVSVVATAVMTAHARLSLGAAAPVATNVLTIMAAVLFGAAVGADHAVAPVADAGGAVAVLGGGTTLAVAVMAGIQLWGARRVLPGLRFEPRLRHPAVRQLARVGGWMLLYVSVNQLGLAIVISMASDVEGAVTAYQWAFALMQLPYAVVAVSIYSAAYPVLARSANAGHDLTASVAGPLTRSLLLLLPASVGLAALAVPATAVLVGAGEADIVAAGLRGFAVSLVPFSVFQLFSRACYARRDTRSPALVNVAVNLTMLIVDVVAVSVLDGEAIVFGLAVGHAASYVVGCVLLAVRLARHGDVRVRELLTIRLGRPVVAAAVVGLAAAVAATVDGGSRVGALALVMVTAGLGLALYLALAGRATRAVIVPARGSLPAQP